MRLINKPIFYLVLLASILLTACGGGGSIVPAPAPEPIQEKGGFWSISTGVNSQKSSIQAAIDAIGGWELIASYDVTAYKLEYWTYDRYNDLTLVSGLIAVPVKGTPSPLLSFQHGTTFMNSEAPSFNLTPEDSPEIAMASLGYIVFSPDYIGYGSSFGKPHPYLQKQPSADVVADQLSAGQKWLDTNNIATTGELFMTGYSQGGYVTMAAAEYLQANPGLGFEVTGAVFGAGPYDLYTALDTLLLGINVPDFLTDPAVDLAESLLIPDDAEVIIDTTFLERFFSGDRQDDVHRWRPDFAVKLFHGEDDKTVPIESAYSTEATMRALGADVELLLCDVTPSGHKPCVPPYVNYLVNYFQGLQIN